MIAKIDVGELRAELARRRWRQEDLARRAGLSVSYVGWVLRGAAPSERAVSKILAALGPAAAGRVAGPAVMGQATTEGV